MIKNWKIFNESTSDTFTEEMAQEILYFFGEDSKVPKNLEIEFNSIYKEHNLGGIVFYETGYDEMKEFTEFLFNKSKEDENLKQKLIDLYYKVREEMQSFPEVYKIEDMYLTIIEDLKYDFFLTVDRARFEVVIKLVRWKEDTPLSEFIDTCKIVEGSLIRLKSDKYTTKLDSCEFHSSFIQFKIQLKAQ